MMFFYYFCAVLAVAIGTLAGYVYGHFCAYGDIAGGDPKALADLERAKLKREYKLQRERIK